MGSRKCLSRHVPHGLSLCRQTLLGCSGVLPEWSEEDLLEALYFLSPPVSWRPFPLRTVRVLFSSPFKGQGGELFIFHVTVQCQGRSALSGHRTRRCPWTTPGRLTSPPFQSGPSAASAGSGKQGSHWISISYNLLSICSSPWVFPLLIR